MISSDPGVNNRVVSKTRTGPWVSPTISLVSALAKIMMFGIAGVNESMRLGAKTFSVFSGVAFENAACRSDKGEKMRARKRELERDKSFKGTGTHISAPMFLMAATNQPFEFATENN